MTMNLRFSFLALATLAFSSPAALAATGNAEAGKAKSAPCAACHSPDGNGTDPQYPRLAGQYRDYLEQTLKEYRAGKRRNSIMAGFATPLSDQDIADLAVYFSGLPGKLDDLHTRLQGD